jgi:Eukaryotic cytochrome b561
MLLLLRAAMYTKWLLVPTIILLGSAGACDFAEAHRKLEQDVQRANSNSTNSTNTSLTTTTQNNTHNSNITLIDVDVDVDVDVDAESDAPTAENAYGCTVDPDSPIHGLVVDLRMISRQTRGRLTLLNNCHFEVTRLEVALDAASNSSIQLDWYSAESLEVVHVANRTLLAHGFAFTVDNDNDNDDDNQNPMDGNATLAFPCMDLTPVGAILLVETITMDETNSTVILGQALIQKLVPGPAADLLAEQPTFFDNCLSLSATARIRWTLRETSIELGLEYVTAADPANTWMSFGPALPGVEDRLMAGSDVVMAGFRNNQTTSEGGETRAFAEDYYIAGYEVCIPVDDSNNLYKYDGVCSDSIWAGNNDHSAQNVELLFSQVLEGVAFLRISRPLHVNDTAWDHSITPGIAQNFIWARGPLDPTQGIAEVQFHGYQFGQLKGIDVNETTWDCPTLQGVELDNLEEDLATQPFSDPSEDEFALQFEHRTVLQGGVIEVFWTLLPETSQIRLGARVVAKSSSKWMSIAVGDSMTDAWAWVATFDGEPQLLGYRMSGLDAGTVQLLEDQKILVGVETPSVFKSASGLLSFNVVTQWPLPGMGVGETAVPLIWALGPSWRGPDEKTPQKQDEHSVRSKAPTTVDFATGSADVGEGPENAVLIAHGAFMWFAWLVAAPLTGVASRFIRSDPCLAHQSGPSWIQIHKNGALAVFTLSIVGLILAVIAVADAGLLHIVTSHAKIGIALLSMVTVQNFFGVLRPPADQVPVTGFNFTKRRVWELSHRLFAITMLSVAVAAVITGSTSLEKFDSRVRYGVPLSIAWIVMVVCILACYEVRRRGIASFLLKEKEKAAASTGEPEKAGESADDNLPIVEPKVAPITPAGSPWTGTLWLVYVAPCILGIAVLVVLVAVAFSGSPNPESEMLEASANQATNVSASDGATPFADTNDATTTKPNIAPYVPSFNTPMKDCGAQPPSSVGDGWCDDFEVMLSDWSIRR